MSDIYSNELNKAMLKAHLSGNEIKVILAYISKGGWSEGSEVFLPESVKLDYGMSDSTVKRARKTLIAKGWMIPTGNKSKWGCDKYLITIPAQPRVGQNDTHGSVKMTPGVGQNDLGGRSKWPTEVTKELTKEVTEVSNEEGAVPAPVTAAGASAPTFLIDINNKEEAEAPASLIVENLPAQSPIVATEERVVQNDLPLDEEDSVSQNEDDYYEWNGRKVLRAGHGDAFDGAALAPVEPEVKTPCSHCDTYLDKSGLCWNMGCTG